MKFIFALIICSLLTACAGSRIKTDSKTEELHRAQQMFWKVEVGR